MVRREGKKGSEDGEEEDMGEEKGEGGRRKGRRLHQPYLVHLSCIYFIYYSFISTIMNATGGGPAVRLERMVCMYD